MFMIMVIARGSFLSFRKKEVVIWLNRKVKMGKMGGYDCYFFQNGTKMTILCNLLFHFFAVRI